MRIRSLARRWSTETVKLLAIASVSGAALSAVAGTNNLLVNGNFNSGASGWSTFTYGGGYASFEIPAKLAGTTATTWPSGWPAGAGTNAAGTGPLYDGTLQLTVGAASGSAGGFAYQTIAAVPNVQYTLTVQAGAENWWLPTGEIRLWFLDGNNAVISSNFVETCLSINNPSQGIALYDTGVPYQNWTNSATSPAGTKFLKVELCNPNGTGSAWFDNAYLTAPINPPVIANLYPDGSVLLQNTNKLGFTASSQASINASSVSVKINGVDVSGSLAITGSGTTNITVSYAGLQPDKVYTAVISITDTLNYTTLKTVTFDTYAPSFTWEAEDYDFNSGQFYNNPVLSATPTAGSYNGVSGVNGVDFFNKAVNGPHVYRPSDAISTSVSGDVTRQNFVNAGVADYVVGYFNGAGFPNGDNVGITSYQPDDSLNYTRTFPAGTYNIYGRLASGNGPTATVHVLKVTSGQGTANQTTVPLGDFIFPANGWGSYDYIPMTDKFGNPVQVTLSGTTTLRVSAGSGANLNFFMLVPADTNTPTITGVYPDGSTLIEGTNKFAFTVSSAHHSIFQSNVVVAINGVTNSGLTFSGTTASWQVTAPLALNVTNYTAIVSVTDDVGNSHSTTVYFDTFNPASYLIEAEDWDFNSGSYIDNPVITSNAAPNSYFDVVGTDNVDSYVGDMAPPTTAPFRFRTLDALSTDVCNDTPTRDLVAAKATNALAFNYNLAYWATNAWANYTHNYPAGQYNVYARLACGSGDAINLEMDEVSPTATNYLGTCSEVGRGYGAFDWVPLVNTNNGQLATVTLGGVATLRATTVSGNINPNSYLLVPAAIVPPQLQSSYSGGMLTLSWNNAAFHLQAQTNAPGTGLGAGWGNYPGGATSPVSVPVSPNTGSVFFRLSN